MSGFKGEYRYQIDSKGRLALPAKLRRSVSPEANETFTVTRGLEQCLFVYPADEWNKIEDRVRNLNAFQADTRFFVRTLFSWANDSTLDGQARLTIAPKLIDWAKLNGEVLIIGALDKIELWNPEVFEAYLNAQSQSYETIAESIMGM